VTSLNEIFSNEPSRQKQYKTVETLKEGRFRLRQIDINLIINATSFVNELHSKIEYMFNNITRRVFITVQ